MRLILALCGATALAPPLATAADLAAGRARAEPCIVCHNAEAIAANPEIPALDGQRERYLQWQLVFFRSGRRANPIMGPLAAELTDEELRNLGAYFASLPRPAPPAVVADPTWRALGRDVAARNRCAACHTDSYAGNQAAPAIAHQARAYTMAALRDYRSAARPSVGVAAMNEAAAALSDDDIVALAHFLENPE